MTEEEIIFTMKKLRFKESEALKAAEDARMAKAVQSAIEEAERELVKAFIASQNEADGWTLNDDREPKPKQKPKPKKAVPKPEGWGDFA